MESGGGCGSHCTRTDRTSSASQGRTLSVPDGLSCLQHSANTRCFMEGREQELAARAGLKENKRNYLACVHSWE